MAVDWHCNACRMQLVVYKVNKQYHNNANEGNSDLWQHLVTIVQIKFETAVSSIKMHNFFFAHL